MAEIPMLWPCGRPLDRENEEYGLLICLLYANLK